MATFLPTTGSLAMSDINGLFGRGNNLNAYRGTTYYTASTGPNTFSSGAISFSNFRGTGPSGSVTVSLAFFEGNSPFQAYYGGSAPIYCFVTLYSDGQTFGNYVPSNITGNWASPTTTGIGSSYWVRFTRTSTSGTNGGSLASTGWLSLASTQSAYSYKTSYPSLGAYTATYTIELSTSSSGSPVVATATSVTVEAYGQLPPP